MTETNTLYKLIILDILSQSCQDISNTLLSDFFLEKSYTDYFTLQEVIADLSDTGLIHTDATHSNTFYTITPYGREMLDYFGDKLSDGIRDDIKEFLALHSIDIKESSSMLASYYKNTSNGYDVRLRIRENGINIVDLTIVAKDKTIADAICDNWKNQSSDVYTYLMNILVK